MTEGLSEIVISKITRDVQDIYVSYFANMHDLE